MDLSGKKYLSKIFRPEIHSDGLNTGLSVVRNQASLFKLSDEERPAAGIRLGDEEIKDED